MDEEIKTPWWTIVIKSPFMLVKLLSQKEAKSNSNSINFYNLSREQNENVDLLIERININIDKQTGMISISVTLQSPALSADIADSIVNRLINYVTNYQTNKAKEDMEYAVMIFNESKQKYYEAQKSYAQYVDMNKNVISESFQIEQERLRNEQSLAYEVYSTLAQQVEQARMKVQEETPCVTVIEPARVPASKSNTSRLVILLGLGFLGLVTGILIIIYKIWNEIFNVKPS